MYGRKTVQMQYRIALRGLVLSLPFTLGLAIAEGGVGQPLDRSAALASTTPRRTVPAKFGDVVVRGQEGSESLAMLQAIADTFSSKDKLDVTFDDHASFGRFCDRDNPFHIVIQEGNLTHHQERCLKWRFGVGTPQPEAFVIGQFRVIIVVHKNNPMHSLDFAGIRKALCPKGKELQWQDIGGAGTGHIRGYGQMGNAWTCQLIQDKCMTRWRDADTPGIREQQRLGFRDDIKTCSDAAEVIAKVRADRNSLGFFATGDRPTEHDLYGVRVLAIATKQGDKPIAPSWESTDAETYPLANSLTLYVHPDAPLPAREFCKFATGPEAAKIVNQFGLWPEYELEKERGKQRLADVKAGKGVEIAIFDLTDNENVIKNLATEFVKAKAAVQLKFPKERTSADLLLTDGDSGPAANLKSVELGRMAVGVVVHPENPLDSLPIDETRAIFCGEIKKWPAVRGVAPVMHVFGLKQSDPIAQLMKEKLGGRSLKYVNQPSSEKVILAVARDPAAIGFVDLSQLPENEKSVKRVKVTVGTKDPRSTNIWYDDNPLARTLTLYVSPKASQTAKDFAEFLTPEHCKEIIAKHNLLPPLHVSSQVADARPKGDGTEGDESQLALDEETVKKPVKKTVEEPKPVATVAEKPKKPQKPAVKYVADEPADTTPEKRRQGMPALSNEQTVWLIGGVVGVIALSLGIGWLRSPHRKRPRR